MENGRLDEWLGIAARGYARWDKEKRPPLINIPEKDVERGRAALRSAGLPEEAWWVALHARDGGFHREKDRGRQDIRNADIGTYLPAIEEIRKRGGWVVRLGDRAMRPLPTMANVFDYPHSALKSEFMDVFLCAHARFMIGCTSGLVHVPIAFHTATLCTNSILTLPQPWNNRVRFVLKPLFDPRARRFLSLDEMIDVRIRTKTNSDHMFSKLRLEARANSEEELRAATVNMLEEFVEGRNVPVPSEWKRRLYENPDFFGSASPAPLFFEKYRDAIF
jgi:putative glycosyltransferase (TIGR04372 family)